MGSWLSGLFANPLIPPAYIAALAFLIVCVRGWPSIRRANTEADKAKADEREGDWIRLRDEIHRLNQRLNNEIERARIDREAQEEENKRCRHELAVISAKLGQEITERVKLQAILDGLGEVRQAGAIAAAEVRLDDLEAKRRGDK